MFLLQNTHFPYTVYTFLVEINEVYIMSLQADTSVFYYYRLLYIKFHASTIK